MASKDIVTIGTSKARGINISSPVGKDQENLREDVMLIQAVFLYIATGAGEARGFLGSEIGNLPLVTGEMNAPTILAIRNFQQKNLSKVLKVDGIIHPASYNHRVIKPGTQHLMSISQLHMLCIYANVQRDDGPDYVAGLAKFEPRLARFLT